MEKLDDFFSINRLHGFAVLAGVAANAITLHSFIYSLIANGTFRIQSFVMLLIVGALWTWMFVFVNCNLQRTLAKRRQLLDNQSAWYEKADHAAKWVELIILTTVMFPIVAWYIFKWRKARLIIFTNKAGNSVSVRCRTEHIIHPEIKNLITVHQGRIFAVDAESATVLKLSYAHRDIIAATLWPMMNEVDLADQDLVIDLLAGEVGGFNII